MDNKLLDPIWVRNECMRLFKERGGEKDLLARIEVLFSENEEMVDFVMRDRPEFDHESVPYLIWLENQDDETITDWAEAAFNKSRLD
jgi:hypothetical protein